MKKLSYFFCAVRMLILVSIGTLAISPAKAQCNFTMEDVQLTPADANCRTGGNIAIHIENILGCSDLSAHVQRAGDTSPQVATIDANGNALVEGLQPGQYTVLLFSGTVRLGSKTTAVSNSYQQMEITSALTNPACGLINTANSPYYTYKGGPNDLQVSVTATVANGGGNPPYTYEITQDATTQTLRTDDTEASFYVNAGELTIAVTDACGFRVIQDIIVPVPSANAGAISPSLFTQADCSVPGDCKNYLAVDLSSIASAYRENVQIAINGNAFVNLPASGITSYGVGEYQHVTIRADIGCYQYERDFGTFKVTEFTNTVLSAYRDTVVRTLNNCQEQISYQLYFTWAQASSGCAPSARIIRLAADNTEELLSTRTVAATNRVNVDGPGNYIVRLYGCDTVDYPITVQQRTPNVIPNGEIESIQLTRSVLEGTGGFIVRYKNFFGPVQMTINRVDGGTAVPFNSPGPFNLAGAYVANFPLTITTLPNGTGASYSTQPIFNLPLGEYRVTVSTGCSQAERIINVSSAQGFDEFVQITLGCLNSNIVDYGLGTQVLGGTSLREGKIVSATGVSYTASPPIYSLPSGNYELSGVLNVVANNVPRYEYSAVGEYPAVKYPFTIDLYQPVQFETYQLFCEEGSTHGSLQVVVTTSSNVPLTFNLYAAEGFDPENTEGVTPLQTITLTDANAKSHLFQDVAVGDYFVQVEDRCSKSILPVKFQVGSIVVPAVHARGNNQLCYNSGASLLLEINLFEEVFDIIWKDEAGNIVGEGTFVEVAPQVTTTYTISSSFKSFLCSGVSIDDLTYTVYVLGEVEAGEIAGSEILCSNTPAPVISSVSDGGRPSDSLAYRWEYSADEGATWLAVSDASSSTLSPGVLHTTTWFRRIVISTTNGVVCESVPSNVVEFYINPLPAVPTSFSQEFCNIDAPTVGDLQVTYDRDNTLLWYLEADLTTALDFDLALVDGGRYVARQIGQNGCFSPFSEVVSVTVHQLSVANAGTDQSGPSQLVFVLDALPVQASNIGSWSVLSVTDREGQAVPTETVVIANRNNPKSEVRIGVETTVVLRWTVSIGNCSVYDDVIIESTRSSISAAPDIFNAVNGYDGDVTETVLSNDRLNDLPIPAGLVEVSFLDDAPDGVLMNSDGTITVNERTRPASYTLRYQICEVLNPVNCATSWVQITINTIAIRAVTDYLTVTVGNEIQTTGVSVLDNDIVDGETLDPPDVILTPGSPEHPSMTMNTDGTISVVPGTLAGTYSFPYTICKVSEPGVCHSAIAQINVLARELSIPNIITPNGDGLNDYFEIVGYEAFERVEITIFTRWGNEVYRNYNYDNRWNGNGLSDDIYYYVINLVKNGKPEVKKGYVIIKR